MYRSRTVGHVSARCSGGATVGRSPSVVRGWRAAHPAEGLRERESRSEDLEGLWGGAVEGGISITRRARRRRMGSDHQQRRSLEEALPQRGAPPATSTSWAQQRHVDGRHNSSTKLARASMSNAAESETLNRFRPDRGVPDRRRSASHAARPAVYSAPAAWRMARAWVKRIQQACA